MTTTMYGIVSSYFELVVVQMSKYYRKRMEHKSRI